MSPSARKGITKKQGTTKHTRTQPQKAAKPSRESKAKQKQHTYPFESASPDSSKRGRHALKWLLDPVAVTTFFSAHFETAPLHLHNPPDKFSSLASLTHVKRLLHTRKLRYNEIDVTSYTPASGRQTHNLEGVAGREAWERYSSGASLRLRRPQAHFPGVRKLCSYLESFLECVVGANIYATPAHSQGFAAHFDDVDAVICQIEGTKRWRVYKRGDEHDVLPRRSSVDFPREEVAGMKRVMDVVLRPGDVLYLPRGAVHEAACEGVESLHVTISFCQRWTWADLLLGSFERAVLEAAEADKRLRQSVSLRFGRVAGAGVDGGERGEGFARMVRAMVASVAKHYPVDYAADRMMERFVQGRLPMTGKGGVVKEGAVVRLVASGCVRLLVGDDGLPVLVTKDARQSCLPEEAGGIKFVLDAYPDGVLVEDIPLGKMQDRLDLAKGLLEMGVLEVLR